MNRKIPRMMLLCAMVSAGLVSFAAAADPAIDTLSDREAVAAPHWTEKLGLDPEQARKFQAAEEARQNDLKTLRDQINAGMLKLRSQLTDSAPEKEVQESLTRMARWRKAVQDREDQFDAVVSSFLSPSQRARLLVWRTLLASRGKAVKGLDAADLRESTAVDDSEPE